VTTKLVKIFRVRQWKVCWEVDVYGSSRWHLDLQEAKEAAERAREMRYWWTIDEEPGCLSVEADTVAVFRLTNPLPPPPSSLTADRVKVHLAEKRLSVSPPWPCDFTPYTLPMRTWRSESSGGAAPLRWNLKGIRSDVAAEVLPWVNALRLLDQEARPSQLTPVSDR
jgi:hypothetical protein